MNRSLLRSNSFVGAAKRLVKKDPHIAEQVSYVLKLLSQDAFDPSLKTHKLKGNFKRVFGM